MANLVGFLFKRYVAAGTGPGEVPAPAPAPAPIITPSTIEPMMLLGIDYGVGAFNTTGDYTESLLYI